MMRRLREMPRYSTADSSVEARYYNRIRLALQRFPSPLRFPLPGLPHFEMYLDNDSWVCLDTSLNDLPVMAWTDFENHARQGLHEPVHCKLHYFHYKAGLLVPKVLNTAEALLAERLDQPPLCQLPGTGKRRRTTARGGLYAVT